VFTLLGRPQRPSLRFIVQPGTTGAGSLRLASQARASHHFRVSERTIRSWIDKGFIRGYRKSPSSVLVDVDEIERELKSNPRMRDGRRARYGPNARIVRIPVDREQR
jgi:hypothetical protein